MVNSTGFFCIQVSTCDLESPLQSEQTISHLEFIKQGEERVSLIVHELNSDMSDDW